MSLPSGPWPVSGPLRQASIEPFAEGVGEVVLGRQVGRLWVVARPADDDALVVDVSGPPRRIVDDLTDGARHLVAAGVDMVAGTIAQRQAGLDGDLVQLPPEWLACADPARQPYMVRPCRDLDLAVGVGVDRDTLRDDGVRDLVAELVGMARQDHFGKADHDGTFSSWV